MWDVIILGTVNGAIYALVAAGLNLQYGVTRILNLAHGQFMMLGAFISAFLFKYYNINPLVGMAISGPIMFALGILIYFLVFRRMVRLSKSGEELEALSLLACFGLLYVILDMMQIVVKYYPKLAYPSTPYLKQIITILGVKIELSRIVAAFIAVTFSVLMYIVLRFTRTGLAMRATSQEPTVAQVVGINIFKVHMISFGLSIFMAAIGGSLLAMILPDISPTSGPMYTFIALAVIVVGGMGSFIGSLVGGFLIGNIYFIAGRLLSPQLSMPVVYAFIIITLLVRPKGLFGR